MDTPIRVIFTCHFCQILGDQKRLGFGEVAGVTFNTAWSFWLGFVHYMTKLDQTTTDRRSYAIGG